jgi:hypothetical protein
MSLGDFGVFYISLDSAKKQPETDSWQPEERLALLRYLNILIKEAR